MWGNCWEGEERDTRGVVLAAGPSSAWVNPQIRPSVRTQSGSGCRGAGCTNTWRNVCINNNALPYSKAGSTITQKIQILYRESYINNTCVVDGLPMNEVRLITEKSSSPSHLRDERNWRVEFSTEAFNLLNSLEQIGYKVVTSSSFVTGHKKFDTKVSNSYTSYSTVFVTRTISGLFIGRTSATLKCRLANSTAKCLT